MVIDAATRTPRRPHDGDASPPCALPASQARHRLLAEDADVLAVIGTGVQGEAHLGLRREREWAEIRVWARPEANAAHADATRAGPPRRR